jgi:hypothetical protein
VSEQITLEQVRKAREAILNVKEATMKFTKTSTSKTGGKSGTSRTTTTTTTGPPTTTTSVPVSTPVRKP